MASGRFGFESVVEWSHFRFALSRSLEYWSVKGGGVSLVLRYHLKTSRCPFNHRHASPIITHLSRFLSPEST